jgi:hypothetical protein
MNLSTQPCAAISVGTRLSCAAAAAGVALFLAGCPPAQKRPAFSWRTTAAVRPIIPALLPPSDPKLPEVNSASAASPPSLQIVLPRPVPPRPRVPPQPSNASSEGSKTDGPLIVPQMSAVESAAAQQEINANLAAAERNLEAVRGKNLNAAQSDTANKTKSFIAEAREAVQSGDWVRARSLAKKAQVLSDELARSL